LARIYKLSPQQIADLTPYQQYEMLNMDENERKTVTFDTFEEVQQWLTARKFK
jgi:hypothetical protein